MLSSLLKDKSNMVFCWSMSWDTVEQPATEPCCKSSIKPTLIMCLISFTNHPAISLHNDQAVQPFPVWSSIQLQQLWNTILIEWEKYKLSKSSAFFKFLSTKKGWSNNSWRRSSKWRKKYYYRMIDK